MRTRPRRGTRVGLLLLGVAALPLGGLALLSAQRVADLDAARAEVAALEAATDDLLAVVALQSAVIDEQTYGQAIAVPARLGVGEELVASFLGDDLDERLDEARARVDALLAEVGSAELERTVLDAREQLTTSGAIPLLAYDPAFRELAGRLDDARFAAASSATGVAETVELGRAVQQLAARAAQRDALAEMANAYYRLHLLPPEGRVRALLDLVAARDRHLQAGIQLERLAGGGPVRAPGDAASLGPASTELLEAVDAAIAAGPEVDDGTSDELELVDLVELANDFPVIEAATQEHIAAVLAAAERVDVMVADVRTRTASSTRWVVAVVVGMVGATVVAVWAAHRVIVRPLRQLSLAAEALRDGGDGRRMPVRGPAEVRMAASALNDATDSLHRVELQANALADGRLDDPSLSEVVSGRLGASVRLAVDRLRRSLGEREEYRRRLVHQASHDPLTGLPNRSAALDHLHGALSRAHRSVTRLAVMFVDLDGFKAVNDEHGHAVGDEILREVAGRLVGGCRDGDLVGRLGGDEFLVVAEPVRDATEARQVADRIVAAVDGVPPLGSVAIGASVGVALSDGDDTAEDLVRAADAALYRAKAAGGRRSALADRSAGDQARAGDAGGGADPHPTGVEQHQRRVLDDPLVAGGGPGDDPGPPS